MICLVVLGKRMSRFYLLLWLKWALRLTLSSILGAVVLSFFVALTIYYFKDMPPLNDAVLWALFDIASFWFTLLWSLTLLLFLFRGMKYIFNDCINGYNLKLLTCPKENKSELVEVVGYGDLVKVWRKWLMLMIWLVGAQMILALIFTHFFSSFSSLFDWFNIYLLYGFILIAGYFSFMILSVRCKRVKIVKC